MLIHKRNTKQASSPNAKIKLRKIMPDRKSNQQKRKQSISETLAEPQKRMATNKKVKDLTGKRFGRLTVISYSHSNKLGTSFWMCRCDCGVEKLVRRTSLVSGDSQSCGCLLKDKASELCKSRKGLPVKFADLTGKKFGRLTVISLESCIPKPNGKRKYRWQCQCECGNIIVTEGRTLRRGDSKSCGCFKKEKASAYGKIYGKMNKRHGMTDSPEWLAWKNMLDRCYNPNSASYKNYGARGIIVTEKWHVFENFFNDMGNRTSEKHSLDRIDSNGNYEPENCRWATQKTQQRNRRSNILITYNDESKCISEWAEKFGLTLHQLWNRIQGGWPFDLAVETPIGVVPDELKVRRGPGNEKRKKQAIAHAYVWQAVRKGLLVKPPKCEHPECHETVIQAHHHQGYEKEFVLDVIWLCLSHHRVAEDIIRKTNTTT